MVKDLLIPPPPLHFHFKIYTIFTTALISSAPIHIHYLRPIHICHSIHISPSPYPYPNPNSIFILLWFGIINFQKKEYLIKKFSEPKNYQVFKCKCLLRNRAEKNWCRFVPCTISAPKVFWEKRNIMPENFCVAMKLKRRKYGWKVIVYSSKKQIEAF